MSDAAKKVQTQLENEEQLKKARVHPIQVLIAAKTYESGHGVRGSGTWVPVPQVIDALDSAYYLAFKMVPPTNRRHYLGLDISGSMWSGCVAGVETLTPAVGTGAMAMLVVKTEPSYYVSAFTRGNPSGNYGVGGRWGGGNTGMEPVSLSPKQRLDDVLKVMQELSRRMGGTDCALPMIDAMNKRISIDLFIVYTDSETYAGTIHPMQALEQYRQKTGIPAKLVVCGLVSNGFTIADPNDAGALDVVGFDTAVPQLISQFVTGSI